MITISRPLPLLVAALLTACGGGGGGGGAPTPVDESPSDSSPPPPAEQPESRKADLTGRNGIELAEVVRLALFSEIESLDSLVLAFGGGAVPALDLENGLQEWSCSAGGAGSVDVREQGAIVVVEYSDCREQGGWVRLDGTVEYGFSNVDSLQGSFDYTVSYTDVRSTIGDDSQTMSGMISIHTETLGGVHVHEIVLDHMVESTSGESVSAESLAATMTHPHADPLRMTMTRTGGSIELSGIGRADLAYLPESSEVHVIGAAGSEVFVTLDGATYSLRFTDEQGGVQTVSVDVRHLFYLSALDGVNAAPMVGSFQADMEVEVGTIVTLDFSREIFDPDLEEIEIALEVLDSAPVEITTVEEGVFQAKPQARGEFVLVVTATDPHGAAATDEFRIVALVDSDGDGIYDRDDPDDDNDGVPDDNDDLPLDPSDSVDTDGDRVGNDADPDDDGDGVPDGEDAFPLDPACASFDQSDGEQCLTSSIRNLDRLFADEAGILYFVIHADKSVFRWDSNADSFLPTLTLGTAVPSDSSMKSSVYVSSHARVYFGYDNGAVTYIDIDGGAEQPFATLPFAVDELADAGNFVLAQGGSTTHYVFASDGTLLANADSYRSGAYAYNPAEERVYFFRDGISPNDLHYEQIDQATGEFVTVGETPYHGSYLMVPPIVISPDGGLVLIGSGNLFNAGALDWAGAIPGGIGAARWDGTDGLVVLREQNGQTRLERYDAALDVVEQQVFDGIPRGIERTATGYAVVTVTADRALIEFYQPSDDTDGDGVVNSTDAFPLDPAASVDTDHDGYPDDWNEGASETDSTTDLVLDAYPNDSACYLPEHGDGTTCDIASTLPEYLPDLVMADADGIVYLLSAENHRVYRYSAAAEQHLSPILVGMDAALNATAPTTMELQPAHQRLYLAYASGAVTYVDLTEAQLQERPFVAVAEAVNGLGAAGEFLLVQDGSGAWGTHYYFDETGTLRDSADWNYFSTDYEWNELHRRLFFFRDAMSPNDLHYEEIGTDGTIVSSGETPYHGGYAYKMPIAMSPDGQYVLVGSGDIYRSDDLTWYRSLLNDFVGVVWDDNGNVVTARDVGGLTRIDRYDASQSWTGEEDYAGVPLSLIQHPGGYLLVGHDGLEPVFTPVPR